MSTAGREDGARGCEACRERHIKCDRGKPCSTCIEKGRRCVRPVKWRFRHSCGSSEERGIFEFPTNLKWRSVGARQLKFIDETVEIEASYGRPSSASEVDFDEPSTPNNVFLNDHETVFRSPTPHATNEDIAADTLLGLALGTYQRPNEIDGLLSSTLFHQQTQTVPSLAEEHFPLSRELHDLWEGISAQGPHGSGSHYHDDTHTGEIATSPVCCFGLCGAATEEYRVFPLQDRHEAELLRCYSEHIAPFLDFHDQKQTHFATSVLEAAGSQPMLMRIIFHVTERYLACFQRHESFHASTQAWSMCQKCLQAATTTRNQVLDEETLAAWVLQRFIVGIEGNLTPLNVIDLNNHEGPWNGMRDVLSAQAELLLPKGLHEAAFWAGVRQEIYISVLHQRPTALCLDRCNVDRSMEDADDEIWVYRITLHLLDVLGFCFGSSAQNISAYNGLVDYLVVWAASVPESFDPLFLRLPEKHEQFPEIMFLNDCAMAAWQYYHLTRLLLTAHNPNAPRIGTNYLAALKSTDNDIKSDVCILCGIAETPGYERKGCMAAIMGITLAGDRFTREGQETLLTFLAKLESDCIWPTRSLQKELKQSWNQSVE
ncbi:hypothetical protein F5Y10DRAFT_103101 [Nemania abortiva]|nr:hypothetical protein F5Y10DRAFT_103101 [Nemania abortiva]